MFEHASQYRCVSVYIFTLNNRRKYAFSNKHKNRKQKCRAYLYPSLWVILGQTISS